MALSSHAHVYVFRGDDECHLEGAGHGYEEGYLRCQEVCAAEEGCADQGCPDEGKCDQHDGGERQDEDKWGKGDDQVRREDGKD